MRYSQNRKVSASLCDTEAKLSVIGVLNLIEDSLTEFMGELRIDGLTAKNKYGAILLILKNHIKILRPAGWSEKIIVESFASSRSALRFCVDTCIKTPDGGVIAYSRVELCGIDLHSRRLRKMETMGVDDTIELEEPLWNIEFNKKQDHDMSFLENITVRSSNIDYVHHTNNIAYIGFLMNTFTVAELEEHPIKEMEINYIDQTFEGDLLSVYGSKGKNKAVFEIRKDEHTVLKCEMLY